MVADAIRQFGHDVTGDLRELWRRLEKTGRKLGLKAAALDAYASAFEQDLAKETRRLQSPG